MKPTTTILESIYQNSQRNPEEVFTRLYRYLLRPDVYFEAYKHLQANNGADTPGVDSDTADGFSEEKVQRIIQALKDGIYLPKPARRTYIDKKNGSGKKRPLGLPVFTDKLVQDAIRMILEAVYEPIFSYHSHGFRPNHSCHTALAEVRNSFTGVRWFIEGDIRGCFDNIDHETLIRMIERKIKDARFLQLIRAFLKAGYMENWTYHATYSGTPQGGIVSPILANIYLHELDKHIESVQRSFEKPPVRTHTPEYVSARGRAYYLSKCIRKATGSDREELIKRWKAERSIQLRTPCTSQTGKIIKYVRYADDFLIGVKGSKQDCEAIKADLKLFIRDTLCMELSEEKTYITHSSEQARFLGFDVSIRRNENLRAINGRLPMRTLHNKTELNIPLKDKIERFMFDRGIIEQNDGKLEPVKRGRLTGHTPLEILQTYNAELRGICNYYSIASNFASLTYFAYLMEYSCLKTLAAKHKTTIGKIKQELYPDGHGKWGIPYKTKNGEKRMYFADFQDCKTNPRRCNDTINRSSVMYAHSRNSLEARIKAKVCELCGKDDVSVELHHVHKVKDLKGKVKWEQCMIAKRRKTLAVCKECHLLIHQGKVS